MLKSSSWVDFRADSLFDLRQLQNIPPLCGISAMMLFRGTFNSTPNIATLQSEYRRHVCFQRQKISVMDPDPTLIASAGYRPSGYWCDRHMLDDYNLRYFYCASSYLTHCSVAWHDLLRRLTNNLQYFLKIQILASGVLLQDTCDILINASGFLNNWRWLTIKGLKKFGGPLLHSANWRNEVSLAGKHMGLIGNGCMAAFPKYLDVR